MQDWVTMSVFSVDGLATTIAKNEKLIRWFGFRRFFAFRVSLSFAVSLYNYQILLESTGARKQVLICIRQIK